MSLANAISEAIATAKPPPPNESTTCEWIIYPLLLAAGYSRRDLVSRTADNNGQFPDYCIMPDSPHCWYLEAKAWSVALEDKHALQSLNYANQNGMRWVVLSNGREWRLYDNRIEGTATEKVAASANLDDLRGVEAFLEAVSRRGASQVLQGELRGRLHERAARRVRGPAARPPSLEARLSPPPFHASKTWIKGPRHGRSQRRRRPIRRSDLRH